jgi:hypothetical protein
VASQFAAIQQAGYQKYGELVGPVAAKLRALLPISPQEIADAMATKGASWAYFAGTVVRMRQDAAEVPKVQPRRAPSDPRIDRLRKLGADAGMLAPIGTETAEILALCPDPADLEHLCDDSATWQAIIHTLRERKTA